ncbi:MAG: hypothetical protein WBX01_09200 [Nitrososphaeraceae archaeon]
MTPAAAAAAGEDPAAAASNAMVTVAKEYCTVQADPPFKIR